MRVLVAAWVGSTNLGDELIFAALVRKLRSGGADVTAVSVDPAGTRRDHGVEAVAHTDLGAILRVTGEADAMVFGGGGLIQDETSPFNLPYHLSRVAVARARRTPAAAVAVGAGPLRTTLGRLFVRMALRRMVGVTVRDEASAQQLRRAGIASRTTADLALSLPGPQSVHADALVACLRPWTAARSRLPVGLRRVADPTDERVVAAFAAGLDAAAGRLGLPVRMVAFQRDRDDALHARVAERMAAQVELLTPGLDTVLDEVARGRVVVAVRYHAGIAATLAGRPAVLIGYSPKVDALAGELGAGARLLAWDAVSGDGIAQAAEAVAGQEAAVRAGRDRLRERERGNDELLDRLLS